MVGGGRRRLVCTGICSTVLYTYMGFLLWGLCLVHVHCRLLSLCIGMYVFTM